jgi:hypothetical protein
LLEKRSKESGYDGTFLGTRPAAIIRFERYFFSIPPCNDEFSPEMEINFFKAMLLVNQEVNNSTANDVNRTDPLDLKMADLFLAYNYSNEGIEPSDINDSFRRQMVRFSELVIFIERQRRLKPARELFRRYYHLSNISQYLVPHIVISDRAGNASALHNMRNGNKFSRKVRYIIKQSSISYDAILNFDSNADYTYFRSNPFIKVGKNDFVTICTKFVLEHIYESVYFQLKPFAKYCGFKDDSDFRRYITTEFTQNWMFNRFMQRCKNGLEDMALTDCECQAIIRERNLNGVEPPDYYIRIGNNILLFELKDTLASAKNKELRNANDFYNELREKFFENNQGKPKAIRQLMANVEAIQNGTFAFDVNSSCSSIVYPVLIVDSTYFTMIGVHTKLNYWMKEYCESKSIDSTKIRPLILMDIATVRLYSTSFKSNGFIQYFEDYYKNIEWETKYNNDSVFNSLKSFSAYMAEFPIEDIQDVFRSVMKNVGKGYKKYKKDFSWKMDDVLLNKYHIREKT